jgi:biopolymer transport protein ExbD
VKRFLQIGFLPFLALLVLSCRQNQRVIARPHGLELAALPTASDAPFFEPEVGHYAELLLRDGQWHAFIDGNSSASFAHEDQMSDFLKSFKDRERVEGRSAVLLISAEGDAPLSEIKNPIRAVASHGIDKIFLLVRSSEGAEPAPPRHHSLSLDFTCPHCRFAKYNQDFEPLVIAIEENGSIRRKTDGALTLLDDSDAPCDLPILNSVLSDYATHVRDENAAPVVRIHLGEGTLYQRFIDVMCRLHMHGLEPEFSHPDLESEIE